MSHPADDILQNVNDQVSRHIYNRGKSPEALKMAILMHPQTWEMLEDWGMEHLASLSVVDPEKRLVFSMHVIRSPEVPIHETYMVMSGDHPDIKEKSIATGVTTLVGGGGGGMGGGQGGSSVGVYQQNSNYTYSWPTTYSPDPGGGWGFGVSMVGNTSTNETTPSVASFHPVWNGWQVYYRVSFEKLGVEQVKKKYVNGTVSKVLVEPLGHPHKIKVLYSDSLKNSHEISGENGAVYTLTNEMIYRLNEELSKHGQPKLVSTHPYVTPKVEPKDLAPVMPEAVDPSVKQEKLDEAFLVEQKETVSAKDYLNKIMSPPNPLLPPIFNTKMSEEYVEQIKKVLAKEPPVAVKTWFPGDSKSNE